MRSNGVIVDDIAKDVGRKQSSTVTDDAAACRMPTDEELLAFKINWITPSMEEVTPQSIRHAKRLNINLRYLMMKKRYQKKSMLFMIIPTLKLERVNVQLESGSNSWLFHQMRKNLDIDNPITS